MIQTTFQITPTDQNNPCSICYENLEKMSKSQIILSCGHEYHKECISKWFEHNKTCPYCRAKTIITMIKYFNKHTNTLYSSKETKRRSIKLNGEIICHLDKLKFQIPNAWINYEKDFSQILKDNIIHPAYKVYMNGKPVYISAYLRQYILNGDHNNDIVANEYIDINNVIYFDTSCNFLKNIPRVTFNILYEWIYNVMFELSKTYLFSYECIYNTLIVDIMINTIINSTSANIKISTLQGIAITSMYNSIKFIDPTVDITWDNINYWSGYLYDSNSKEIQIYNNYQQNYIKENYNKL
jgi:hypothetical protein